MVTRNNIFNNCFGKVFEILNNKIQSKNINCFIYMYIIYDTFIKNQIYLSSVDIVQKLRTTHETN